MNSLKCPWCTSKAPLISTYGDTISYRCKICKKSFTATDNGESLVRVYST